MDAARAASPTLRITRHGDTGVAGDFAFDVWNPFTGRYQPASSLPEGLRRVDELASLIGQMHARKHPREAALIDAPGADLPAPEASAPEAFAPDAEPSAANQWAEFRVNPAAHPTYDTRRSEQLGWTRSSGGKTHATETVCNNVGYGPAASRLSAARR